MENKKVKKELSSINWEKVLYSKSIINAAGNSLANKSFIKLTEKEALDIVNNWRAAHAFPLNTICVFCKRKTKSYKHAIVVTRLKRLNSIIEKLRRMSSTNLARMQDLGGCRVIVDNIEDMYSIINVIKSTTKHKLIKENDYIKTPKNSGYRSVHLIYKYAASTRKDYNDLCVEIQIRTKLQHLWATAVEVAALCTKNNLKASQGDEKILRYMELVSALFAFEEGTQMSSNVPQSRKEIIEELDRLKDTNVISTLSAFQITAKSLLNKRSGYYLLIIDFQENSVATCHFKTEEINLATQMYEEYESKENGRYNTVLVSAENVNEVKKAYPNYFADVSEFIEKTITLLNYG